MRVPATIAFHAVLAAIALALGAFVLARRSEDARALLLFVLMTLYGLLHFADAGPIHRYGFDSDANLIQILVTVGAGLFYFPVLLHLFLVFPARRQILTRYPALVRQIYTPAVLLALLGGAALVALIRVVPPESRELSDLVIRVHAFAPVWAKTEPWLLPTALVATAFALMRIWRGQAERLRFTTVVLGVALVMLFASAAARAMDLSALAVLLLVAAVLLLPLALVLLVYPIAACVACWRSYQEAGAEGRRQLRWPLLGLLLAIVGYLLTSPAVQLVAWLQEWPMDSSARFAAWWYAEHAPELGFLLIPVSIVFAILRYRLFDIDVYIRRTIIYGGLTGILAIVFLIVIAGTGTLLSRSFAAGASWSPVAATLLAGALVLPVRARIQTAVDSRFYRRRDYPAALARITARIAADPGQYGAVVAEIQEAIPARSVSLWLRSSEAPMYELKAQSSDTGLPRRIAVSEAEAHLRLRGDYIQQLSRGEGFLVIGAKLAETAWDDHDRNFLTAVSGQISLASSGTARDEADRAAEIQRALLPAALPQLREVAISALSQPARNVGGDYYDAIRLDADRVALAIADVSGKGVPAALLMSNVQAALRLLATEVKSPAALCSRLNAHVCGNVNPGRFVTFVYGVLHARSGLFVYCNAGHNAPVVTRDHDRNLRLETGGVPLGIVPGYRYSEETIHLHPGDRLILYTDGVCDATNEQEQDFGDDGLLSTLAECNDSDPNRLRDIIFDRVEKHCGGVFSDDVTLLVACYRGTRAGAESRSVTA